MLQDWAKCNMPSRHARVSFASMRRPLGSVWLAIIVGMLGWSLRTLPALPLQAEPTFAAVNEPALPPAYRLRAQLATLALDLRGKPADGLRAHLLPSRSSERSTCGRLAHPISPILRRRRSLGRRRSPLFPDRSPHSRISPTHDRAR
jgi:hypothetical protein